MGRVTPTPSLSARDGLERVGGPVLFRSNCGRLRMTPARFHLSNARSRGWSWTMARVAHGTGRRHPPLDPYPGGGVVCLHHVSIHLANSHIFDRGMVRLARGDRREHDSTPRHHRWSTRHLFGFNSEADYRAEKFLFTKQPLPGRPSGRSPGGVRRAGTGYESVLVTGLGCGLPRVSSGTRQGSALSIRFRSFSGSESGGPEGGAS